MSSKTIIGLQTGDEGKAAVIDRETDAELTVRFQGGANAGHTVVDKHGKAFIFHLLPSAFLRKGRAGIGKGVVCDLAQLDREALDLENNGYEVNDRLSIDEKMMLAMPYHRVQDAAEEWHRVNMLGEEPIGSTWRGISPAYADEKGRRILFAMDLKDKDRFTGLVKKMCDEKERLIQSMGVSESAFADIFDQITEKEKRAAAKNDLVGRGVATEESLDFTVFRAEGGIKFNAEKMAEVYWEIGKKYLDCLTDLKLDVVRAIKKGVYVVFEGAQGSMLDIREGYTPNVTGSHTIAAGVSIGVGIAAKYIDTICGVAKAYETKVGSHIFVTQMDDNDPLAIELKKIEFGSTTGRQRMVGWFDGVEMRTAQLLNGCDEVVITKLDPMSGAPELKICTSYFDPKTCRTYEHCPQDPSVLKRLEPRWLTTPGWEADIAGCTKWGDLPKEAQVYVAHIASTFVDISAKDVPIIASIGTGPKRDQFIADVPPTYKLMEMSAHAEMNKKK